MSLLAVLLGLSLTLTEDPPAGAGRCADGRVWTSPVADQDQMLDLLNRTRAGQALPPVERMAALDRIALAHSADMACRRFFDHRNPEGLRFQQRLAVAPIRPEILWRRLAEVLGTSVAPSRQLDGWLNSPGHRAAILEREHDGVGIAAVRIDGSPARAYWTVDFLAKGAP